jgi:hypothetical protein
MDSLQEVEKFTSNRRILLDEKGNYPETVGRTDGTRYKY